jgi:hypothetical protein
LADAGVIIQSTGLSHPLAQPSTGLSVGGGFHGSRQLGNPLNEPEYWVSCQIRANSLNDEVWLGFDLVATPTPLISFGRIVDAYFVRQAGSPAVQAGVASPVGVTDLLVARFKQFGGVTIVDLWVNTVNFALPPLISLSVPTVAYTWANLEVQPGLVLDEIRTNHASSPYTTPMTGPQQYYRVILQ